MSEEAAAATTLSGACHCGRVRVTMPADSVGAVVCHCADCPRLHGNSFALFAAERSAVRWEGEEHVRWYRSSPANERSFCAHCGSRLAKRPVAGTRIMVSAGLFDRAPAQAAPLEDATDDHRACSRCAAALPARPAYW